MGAQITSSKTRYAAERAKGYTDALLSVEQPMLSDQTISDLVDELIDCIHKCSEAIELIAKGV
jgi:hypothetical protein